MSVGSYIAIFVAHKQVPVRGCISGAIIISMTSSSSNILLFGFIVVRHVRNKNCREGYLRAAHTKVEFNF